jgi:hypothetical protein
VGWVAKGQERGGVELCQFVVPEFFLYTNLLVPTLHDFGILISSRGRSQVCH